MLHMLRFNRRIPAIAAFGLSLGVLWTCAARAADDSGTFSALAGVVGFDTNNSGEHIDYRDRPRLVVPPNRGALPEPRAADASRPASFPVDQGGARRQGARVVARSGGGDNEPARENLTQPPGGYRHATADLSKISDPERQGHHWWNPFDIGPTIGSLGKGIGLGSE
jgi:hypothetical protein